MPKSLDDLLTNITPSQPRGTEETVPRGRFSGDEEENKKARAKAMRLLEHMDRTEKGLYEKLKLAEFSERAIADAMAYVKSFGYINDLRYAETYLRTRLDAKSRQQLVMELMRKGVDRQTIDHAWEAVSELEEPDERSMIESLILKKYTPGTTLDVKAMRRLYGQLMRKGFRSSDIRSVMNQLDLSCTYMEE